MSYLVVSLFIGILDLLSIDNLVSIDTSGRLDTGVCLTYSGHLSVASDCTLHLSLWWGLEGCHVKHGIAFCTLHAFASAPLSTQTMSLLWTAFVTICDPKQESAPCFACCSALINTASPTCCGWGMWFAFSLLLCALASFFCFWC